MMTITAYIINPLFFKRALTWKDRAFYLFFYGSLRIDKVGTFLVNIVDMVSIIEITITSGDVNGEYFHYYYGKLFFPV